MNINIDINIRATEDITNSLLTLAAVLHNAIPIFNENSKAIGVMEGAIPRNKQLQAPNEIVEKAKQEVKEITLQEIRDMLTRLSKNGKKEEVKALIKKFGATKITEIPKEKYGELLSEIGLIN